MVPIPIPTDAELEILTLIWANGWSTVADIYAELSTRRDIGYTAVLKLMQNMFAKGLVRRDESRRKHLYDAVEPADTTRRKVLTSFVARAFNGSPADLIRHALALAPITDNDRAALRALIEQPANSPPSDSPAPDR